MRSPELVGPHLDSSRQLGVELSDLRFGRAAAGGLGGQRQARDRDGREKGQQQQDRLDWRRCDERADPPQRALDRRGRQHEHGRHGFAGTEPQRDPQQNGKWQEGERISALRGEARKHRVTDGGHGREHPEGFDIFPPRPARQRFTHPGDDERREDQRACGVAKPPREPYLGDPIRRHEPGGKQRQEAYRGADERRRKGRFGENEDRRRRVECREPAGKPPDQRGAGQTFERAAGGNDQRRGHRVGGQDVNREGRHEDRGQHPITNEETRRQRDARRRPDAGNVRVVERERQAEAAGRKVTPTRSPPPVWRSAPAAAALSYRNLHLRRKAAVFALPQILNRMPAARRPVARDTADAY